MLVTNSVTSHPGKVVMGKLGTTALLAGNRIRSNKCFPAAQYHLSRFLRRSGQNSLII
jgi:hypothetical protein